MKVFNSANLAPLTAICNAILALLTTAAANIVTILAIVLGLPTLSETGGTVTTDGTEQNVYINNTPLGVFNPICVKIDFTDHTATETIVLRTYYRILSIASALILQDELTYVGLVSPELININLEPNRFGVQITIEKTAGTNRDYDWEVFYEI